MIWESATHNPMTLTNEKEMKMFKKYLLNVSAFDNQPGWKLDENGVVELKDGNPVYLDSNGDEMTVGMDTISRLNGEAKKHREEKEAALEKLKAFEGIDPDKAREAMEKLKGIDEKKLIDSGEVEELKRQIKEQMQTEIAEKDSKIEELIKKDQDRSIKEVFSNSEFVRNNLAVPADMFEATFRNNFKIEDGKVVAIDKNGNTLYSKERAGELATPEEALKILAESHPRKEEILRADVGRGSGNKGNGGSQGGGRYMKRSDFEKLSPAQQSQTAEKMRSGEITLTD